MCVVCTCRGQAQKVLQAMCPDLLPSRELGTQHLLSDGDYLNTAVYVDRR